MKNIYRVSFFTGLLAAAGILFNACTKADSSLSYGLAKIYMPQAINLSAGVNNNYAVPSGTDSSTYNYKIDAANKKLNVILGVSLSGKDAPGGYTVRVATNADTVNQLIANTTLDASTVLMPASMYTLPSQVVVPAGVRGLTFYLSMDLNQLKANYANKKLALAVKLSDPTAFSLNEAISTVIVVVNVAALNL